MAQKRVCSLHRHYRKKKVIEHKKFCKIISKGPNYREPETINWNKSKQSMEVGSDNLIQGKLSVNKKDICRIS